MKRPACANQLSCSSCARQGVERASARSALYTGTTISTSGVGDAVRRNRVKRVCRECFRQWPGLVPSGIDLIVIARPGAPELDLSRAAASKQIEDSVGWALDTDPEVLAEWA